MRRLLILFVLLGAVAGAGYFAWQRYGAAPTTVEAQEHGRRGRRGGGHRGADANEPIPVLGAASTRRDVPVLLDAIGTVQAFNTVSVKPMVDGPLTEVRFREGQDVHAGDVLARIDPRPYQATLDQYTAKKAQDDAQLANARVDLGRYQKLVAQAYTSGQTADTQRATVAQDEALVRQDQAQIDSARTQLSYTTISSPIDGRTGIRQIDNGNIVHAADSTPLTVITQLQPISVVFTLPQQDLPQVSAALARGTPAVDALPQGDPGTGPVLDHGQVAVLDNQVDAATGTIKLKATFPNAALKLWPGGFVGVRLHVDTQRQVVAVAPAAVQRGPRGNYVYVVGSDNTAARRSVAVGYQDEQVAVVTNGLDAGERVVTDGASRLTDGARVAPSEGIEAPATNGTDLESQVAPGTRAAHQRRRGDAS